MLDYTLNFVFKRSIALKRIGNKYNNVLDTYVRVVILGVMKEKSYVAPLDDCTAKTL